VNRFTVWDWAECEPDAFNICAVLRSYGFPTKAVNGWLTARRGQRCRVVLCKEHPSGLRAVAPFAQASDDDELRMVLHTMIDYCTKADRRNGITFHSESRAAANISMEVLEQIRAKLRESGHDPPFLNTSVPAANE
jgi:hypothetical protein